MNEKSLIKVPVVVQMICTQRVQIRPYLYSDKDQPRNVLWILGTSFEHCFSFLLPYF